MKPLTWQISLLSLRLCIKLQQWQFKWSKQNKPFIKTLCNKINFLIQCYSGKHFPSLTFHLCNLNTVKLQHSLTRTWEYFCPLLLNDKTGECRSRFSRGKDDTYRKTNESPYAQRLTYLSCSLVQLKILIYQINISWLIPFLKENKY